MSHSTTDTAHLAWDNAWQTEAGRADWLVPEDEVSQVASRLRVGGAVSALDLGCGVGRHTLALARLGFRVSAVDASQSGLAELRRAAGDLPVEIREARMTELPFADGQFDYVLSWNVIYHGDGEVVRASIAEIRRVLKPGGIYQGTMLTKRNRHCGRGREVAPDTWVDETAGDDKRHPHFFCDAAGLCQLFRGFEILDLKQHDHGRPDNWHWRLLAQKS